MSTTINRREPLQHSCAAALEHEVAQRWEGDAPLSKRFLCGLSCVTVKVSSKIILLEVAEERSMVILNLRFRTQYDLYCFLSIHSI